MITPDPSKWTIGNPDNPTAFDQTFTSQEKATAAALKATADDSIWAVWAPQDDGAELVALCFAGRLYVGA